MKRLLNWRKARLDRPVERAKRSDAEGARRVAAGTAATGTETSVVLLLLGIGGTVRGPRVALLRVMARPRIRTKMLAPPCGAR